MPYIGNPIYQSAFVVDQFSGNGSTTAFTMSVAPAGVTNVLVAVSGVLQDPSTYGVVGNTITFSAAPPSGTGNISCRYLGVPASGVTTTAYRTVTEFTATASQTTFTPPSYTVGFINVYLNGVLLGSADYTATNGTTVVLTTGALAGNLVTVESFLVSSVLNAIPNTAGSINLAGSVVTGTLPVANGGTGVTTSTGTGATVRGTSPTLTTPIVATTIGVGGATPSASGAGITFPATQSASSDANTLDDYEEGTWTPTNAVVYGFTPGTISSWGNYVKIGDYVYVNCRINYNTSETLVVGDRGFISGLPFAATGSVNQIGGGTFVQPGSFASNTNAFGITTINTSANEMGFMVTIVNGTPPALNSTFLGFFAVYKVNNTLS
jgi:hypothetical protein